MLTSAASVPKLIDAVLALNVLVGPEGVSSAVDRVDNRQEFVRPVPSTFPVVLGVVFESEADVPVAIEVRHMGKAVWVDTGTMTPSKGRGEQAFTIPLPVLNVGPSMITLRFGGQEVWTQTIFFASE